MGYLNGKALFDSYRFSTSLDSAFCVFAIWVACYCLRSCMSNVSLRYVSIIVFTKKWFSRIYELKYCLYIYRYRIVYISINILIYFDKTIMTVDSHSSLWYATFYMELSINEQHCALYSNSGRFTILTRY